MKYIRQLGIILLVSFLGELLHYLLRCPSRRAFTGSFCSLPRWRRAF